MPTANGRGHEWGYNKFTYGLIGRIIESVTGQQFANFVQQRNLVPLEMSRTAVKGTDLARNNVAVACAKLGDGKFVHLESVSWPCEHHTSLLASTGMRSSLNDMPTLCKAVLTAEKNEKGYPPALQESRATVEYVIMLYTGAYAE
ncbi:hypothetical protein BBP40_010977 [Aspergillus hancockii]|nr:hypothetical protein BBP40_010977 [Aspergillus hancockii]